MVVMLSTRATRGSAATLWVYRYSQPRLFGEKAEPETVIATDIGVLSPGGKAVFSRSKAWRDGTDVGKMEASGELSLTCRNGTPSRSKKARAGRPKAMGRRITTLARRSQKRVT